MTEHFNGLTEPEAERLAVLIEECGEVIQAACKVLRHGYSSWNPDIPISPTNREDLAREVGHVYHATQRMINACDLSGADVEVSRREKAVKIARYLHHQNAGG